jgi:hypothetical protein
MVTESPARLERTAKCADGRDDPTRKVSTLAGRVLGPTVTMEGEQAVITREIGKGDHVLTVRDANGVALWT